MAFYTIKSFLRHQWHARRWSAFHSPFLFDLFCYCCNEKNNFPLFQPLEARRKVLKEMNHVIDLQDYGAGHDGNKKRKRKKISNIAQDALSLPFQCRFMARLAAHERVNTILEFGTSLGISAAYLKSGSSSCNLCTVEGDRGIAKIAQSTFTSLGLNDIQLIVSTFDEFISNAKDEKEVIDLLFLDGHHQSDALIRYFNLLKPRFNSDSIVVVDDIYWSEDMQHGWQTLISLTEVTQSVDCFHFGILFFKKEFLSKEHHQIRLPIQSILRT